MKLRLDKYLADMGIGTRTEVKALLKKGCVTLNGDIVKKPEIKVNTETDKVFCHGQAVGYVELEYLMFHKPAGVLTATEDRKQKTVLDFLDASVRKDVFPVGRLDKDTEGLLLITNDGALAHELLSPKKHIPKRYYALVDGIMEKKDIEMFAEGLLIPACEEYPQTYEFTAMPATLEILSIDVEKGQSEVEIEVCEGKFHQVKRMCEAVGKKVMYLKRVSMGSLELDLELGLGEYRRLSEPEVEMLKGQIKKA